VPKSRQKGLVLYFFERPLWQDETKTSQQGVLKTQKNAAICGRMSFRVKGEKGNNIESFNEGENLHQQTARKMQPNGKT